MTSARSRRAATLARFCLGKSERAVGRIAPLCPAGLLDRSFVDLGRLDPEIDTGGGEQPRPHGTGRSEDQIPQPFMP